MKMGIPEDLDFSMLELRRDTQTGDVTFRVEAIQTICVANNVDLDVVMGHEDNVAGLIIAWYAHHLLAGGKADPVADDLIDEVRLEDAKGGGFSVQPGRA
ncbi:MAG: hypothetical protein Q8L20_10865 [Gammaproteobacteria bacterium]|nr:hypothetical protein [Gammaproteobacteria bacterium]